MPDQAPASAFPDRILYKEINARHPDYDGEYLRQLKAFYQGGRALLRNKGLMEQVFPRYRDESDQVYLQRCRRAFYVPYAGEILNFVVSSMAAQQLEVKQAPPEGSSESPEPPAWWKTFFKDVSPPGGKRVHIHDHVKAAILDALQVRISWHRVDLPNVDADYATLGEEDAAGARNAYIVPIPAECVIDWEEDDSGELLFVVTYSCESKRSGVTGGRDSITEVWRVYDRTGWARYQKVRKRGEKPDENEAILRSAEGQHSFGRVPIVRLDVGDGLWAMDNIESLVREHFNKRSALAWAEFQSLFQELYEFLGPEEAGMGAPVIGESQQDAKRAKKQRRGQGFVQERGKDDDARFVGPDPGSFGEARKSCDDLRTEIHRVTHQMALAVDNSAAALRRSADSKGQDKASAVVVFEALGQMARTFAENLCRMVALGRGERDLADKWQATGMAKFDAISVDAEIERDVSLETISIPSPTFQRWRKGNLAKLRMGDEATPEMLKVIEDELEESITAEAMQPNLPTEKVDLGKKKPGGDEDDEGDEDAKGDAEDREAARG
jgi:hypothetical protein